MDFGKWLQSVDWSHMAAGVLGLVLGQVVPGVPWAQVLGALGLH